MCHGTDFVQVAVCNLASINLSALVIPPAAEGAKATYDFEKLQHIAEVVTRNLNRVIDANYYPIEEARNSNMRHRPIGIGVQVRKAASLLLLLWCWSCATGFLGGEGGAYAVKGFASCWGWLHVLGVVLCYKTVGVANV